LYPKDANLAYDESMYEMESLKEFRLRAEVALNDILEDSEGCSVIAIVSHGGLINMLYRCFMRMGYNNDVRYPTGDTGIHIWEVENNDRKILLSNYLDHLN
jgi:2,3-bisphosphoglycerate-dependent phosphoglycerate mutase